LDASNVKALFRRGQAMVGLNRLSDAQKGESSVSLVLWFFFPDGLVDFQEVLKLDPKNQAVKDELTKLAELTRKKELKPRVVRYWLSATSSAIDQTCFEDNRITVLGASVITCYCATKTPSETDRNRRTFKTSATRVPVQQHAIRSAIGVVTSAISLTRAHIQGCSRSSRSC
jgi:hypothetical protein